MAKKPTSPFLASLCIDRSLDRLRQNQSWFPFPLMFSFGVCLVFNTQVLTGINPRLGHSADVISYQANAAEEGAIWLSLTVDETILKISTADRQVIEWDVGSGAKEGSEKLADYLLAREREISLSASLSKEVSHTESIVVLAVDQSLKYLHLKPVLLALAKAGISEYAFETKQPLLTE